MFIDQIMQKVKTRNGGLVIIMISLLVVLTGLLIYRFSPFWPAGQESKKITYLSAGDKARFMKIYEPLLERTKDAYQKTASDLPYKDPAGEFSIKYISNSETSKIFSVDTKAKTWEVYAERTRKAVQFFKDRGVDPCSINVVWGSDKSLLGIPTPSGLDLGCPVNVK